MGQTIAAGIIIAIAVITAAVKLYRFFRRRGSGSDCRPESCASCPYSTGPGACGDPDKIPPDQKK
ncbi:MAG: FeoB-associated Cys-rich membrane protein [Spirochaetes bacterium]|nr:FeoB-associated Cys-rich membrane protein [Spirochaetota bacterium]